MSSENNSTPFMYVGPLIHSLSLKDLQFISNGVIVVSDGKIVYLQKNCPDLVDIQKRYGVQDKDVYILKKGQFLIPGFVDTHIHGPQYPNIGLGYDLPLLGWLDVYTFPLEKKFKNEFFAEKIYNAVVKKTLSCGTTTACYFATIHKNSSLIFVNCIKNLGQRAFVGKVNMNKNTPPDYGETYEESLRNTKDFIENVLSLNNHLIKPIITPRFALSCDMKLMKALADMAVDYGLLTQTHVSENVEEIKKVKEEFPDCKNYIDVYDRAGLVNNKTILAHGIYLSSEELDVIKKRGAAISHCALSNLLLQSGICPMRKYIDAGLKLSLGTDCSGGSSCSMLESIRQTLQLSVVASFQNLGKNLSVEEVFYMATLGGAEAVGLQNVIGNFVVGKDFDALMIDMENNPAVDILEDYTLNQLFQKFIYLGDERIIKKVFVAGKIVKQL